MCSRFAHPHLWLVVFFGFQLAGEVKPQLAESSAQGVPRNPQETGGLVQIRPSVLHDAGQQEAVHVAVRFGIKVACIGAQPQADRDLQVGSFRR